MALPEGITRMFEDREVIDAHVNVGHAQPQREQFVDGTLDGDYLLRQFDPPALFESGLGQIGLRTHYSPVAIPPGQENKFIPSVPINWIGYDPDKLEAELARFVHPHPIIWFHSFSDPYHQSVVHLASSRVSANVRSGLVVSHTDEFGRLTPQALEVLEIARDRGAVVATAHCNWERTVPLIIQAVGMGLRVLWVHPDSRLIQTPVAVQKALVEMGRGRVAVERAAVFLRDGGGYYSASQVVSDVRAIGSECMVFTSDLGRFNSKDPLFPDEGLMWYMEQLVEAGLTTEEAKLGLVINPSRLFEE